MERLKALFSTLATLTDNEWQVVDACFTKRLVKKNGKLLSEGEVCDEIFFVENGALRMYFLNDGLETIHQFFLEGSFASDMMSLTTQEPSARFIEAIEDSEIIVLHKKGLDRLFTYSLTTQQLCRHFMDERFRIISERLTSIARQSPEERYLDILTNRPELIQRIPQYMLASYLGVTPEGLSRIRKRIAVAGIS